MNIKEIARNILVAYDILRVSTKETILTLFRGKSFRFSYIESRMLVVAHSLEKGLSMKVVKKGFGVKKATNLCYYIEKYMRTHNDSTAFCLIESIGILQAYQTYQRENDFDLGKLNDRIDSISNSLCQAQRDVLCQYSYGTIVLSKEYFKKGESAYYEEFIKSRRSARHYSDKSISEETILKAVELTNYAPSACNRQPSRVYVALGREKAAQVGELLGNKNFTKDVDNFAIITCDRAYFAGDEHFQWYVNGGIYLSYFVNALHSLGIGSCIMQWFAFSKNEKKIKKLLGIKKSEAIIASISMGYYPDEITCICAQRINSKENLIVF